MPECNAAWGDESITRFGSVDLGVAVALEDGLITPIIRGADKLSLLQLAAQTKSLVERARARKRQPEEYTGATFSVSNLGMMGIEHFTAILNPPAAGILAVGALVRTSCSWPDAMATRPLRVPASTGEAVVEEEVAQPVSQAPKADTSSRADSRFMTPEYQSDRRPWQGRTPARAGRGAGASSRGARRRG